MWHVVGDVREDMLGGIHAVQELIVRQHVLDGLPLRDNGRHLQQVLCLFFGKFYCLGSQKMLVVTLWSVSWCNGSLTCCSCASVMSLYLGGFNSCWIGRNTFCRSSPVSLARMSCTAGSVNLGWGMSDQGRQ